MTNSNRTSTPRQIFQMLMVILCLSLMATACEDDDANALAPKSVGGLSYEIIVNSGASPLASTGSAIISFRNDGTYVVDGDDQNIDDDQGTFTYQRLSNINGRIELVSTQSAYFKVTYTFAYTTVENGNFTAVLDDNPAITQQGSFFNR